MSLSVSESLEVTIGSDPRLTQPRNAALISLCRLLARQVDDAGDDASTRLTAAYLSALKDLNRALGAEQGGTAGGKLGELRSVPRPA